MTVKITKPALNLREELADLRKPSGIAGEALLRADSVQEQRDLINAGRKNLLINGDMQIAQRGTSATASSSTYSQYISVDHWAPYYLHTDCEQVDADIENRKVKALKITAGGTNGRNYVYTKIENGSASLGGGQPFSISFWAKSSQNLNYTIEMRYYASASENNGSTTILATEVSFGTEWKRYTFNGLTAVDGSHSATRDAFLLINAGAASEGTGNDLQITEVQLELGSVATDFEHRSYGEELALCMRYYEKPDHGRVTGYHNGTVRAGYQFRTQKRAVPSVTITNAVDSGGNSITLAASNITKDNMSMHSSCNASSGIQAKLEIDAEL
jgi:hypothetical protein